MSLALSGSNLGHQAIQAGGHIYIVDGIVIGSSDCDLTFTLSTVLGMTFILPTVLMLTFTLSIVLSALTFSFDCSGDDICLVNSTLDEQPLTLWASSCKRLYCAHLFEQ